MVKFNHFLFRDKKFPGPCDDLFLHQHVHLDQRQLRNMCRNSIFLDRVRINFLGETQGYRPRRSRGSSSVQVSDIIFQYENLKNRDEVVNFRLEYRKNIFGVFT